MGEKFKEFYELRRLVEKKDRMQQNKGRQETYRPFVAIVQITALHTMGRVAIALADKPDCVCGMARRIGYTGMRDNDLAIYRLKVKEHANANAIMLPTLFVVDEGLFVEYEVWQEKNKWLVD